MAEIDVQFEDNSTEVLKELEKATEKALYKIGLLGVQGCVEKASDIDDVTGRPTVDTGRYRAAFGFITPANGKMSGTPTTKSEITDDISSQRADKNTVVIANNVEYAPYLEVGSGTKEGGHHARYIMKRGVESKISEMEKAAEDVFEGKEVDLSVDFGGV